MKFLMSNLLQSETDCFDGRKSIECGVDELFVLLWLQALSPSDIKFVPLKQVGIPTLSPDSLVID